MIHKANYRMLPQLSVMSEYDTTYMYVHGNKSHRNSDFAPTINTKQRVLMHGHQG